MYPADHDDSFVIILQYILTKHNGVAMKSGVKLPAVPVSGELPAIMTLGFRGFPQSL
jgi:hypothetical protein